MAFPRSRIPSRLMAVVGSILIFGSLIWYQVIVGRSLVVGSDNVGLLEETAYALLAALLAGLVLAFVGISGYLRRPSVENHLSNAPPFMRQLSSMISEKRSGRVFVLAGLAYGLFFAFASGTLVFQPGGLFSQTYGVAIPSIVPVVCCGSFGQMPQFVVYVTQQLAILIVPVNLVLLFTVSWLVGMNAAIANYAYLNRGAVSGVRWFTALGATVGLFTVCPTCAGLFFLTSVGLTGVVALALTLSSLQAVFIAVGFPILVITPILATRRMSSDRACSVVEEHSVSC